MHFLVEISIFLPDRVYFTVLPAISFQLSWLNSIPSGHYFVVNQTRQLLGCQSPCDGGHFMRISWKRFWFPPPLQRMETEHRRDAYTMRVSPTPSDNLDNNFLSIRRNRSHPSWRAPSLAARSDPHKETLRMFCFPSSRFERLRSRRSILSWRLCIAMIDV